MNLLFATAVSLLLFCSALGDPNDIPVSNLGNGESTPMSTTKADLKSAINSDERQALNKKQHSEEEKVSEKPSEKTIDSEDKEEENSTMLEKMDIDRTARSAGNNVVIGRLKVYIKNARNLPDTDPWLNDPDPFVRVTAVYDTQSSRTLNTNHISSTRNPTWNQWLDFGAGRFQCLQISVWDEDWGVTGGDDRMTSTQSLTLRPGTHRNVRHCGNRACTVYMIFDYHLDQVECSPNPCQNGGICRDGLSSYTCSCRNGYVGPRCQYNFCLSNPCRNGGRCTSTTTSYTCSCPRGYGGNRCQYRRGRLRIYARNGHNLPDEDPWLNDSDPYLRVIAYRRTGSYISKRTRDDVGDQSPEWYEWLDFGYGEWYRFTVQVWDEDLYYDDVLSPRVIYQPRLGCHRYIKLYGNRGYVKFDYCFEL